MQIPAEVKPACWGAVGGAVALAIVGFMWGGWVTGGKAEARANERATAEVVKVLAPICADRFMHHANVSQNLDELNKINSWKREILRRERRLGNAAWEQLGVVGSRQSLRGDSWKTEGLGRVRAAIAPGIAHRRRSATPPERRARRPS